MENILQDAISAPVSPAGQFLSNSVLSLSVIAVLETDEVPFDDSQAMYLLRTVFLPINPRFSSIIVHTLSFFFSSLVVPFISILSWLIRLSMGVMACTHHSIT
ncbi:hypothetical protein DKX38_011915 [Salix brachista]|uniref:Uncharacterized protein n=1 Tax=Salix brachista TaxID=2182728 RepID=A0A5N5M0A1_9ROSI|nr:hypothetical protein DKX38_011915 [Salix brachista]